MNLQTCQDKAIQLINQYSVNGNLITTKNNDYYSRFNNLCDAAQKEIAGVRKIPSIMKFSQNLPPNLINQFTAFTVQQHTNQDVILQGLGAKSYYFECDGNATVTFEVNGTVQSTINCVSNGTYVPYSGSITANPTDNVVLRFSGQYIYNIWNIALYAYNFPGAIPAYRAYSSYALPSDFWEMRDLQLEETPFDYIDVTDYKLQVKTLYISSLYTGNFVFTYYKYPLDITKDTLMTYTFEIETEAQELIPYYVAGHLYLEDNPSVATQLLNEYEIKLSKLKNVEPTSEQTIQDVWGWF